MPIGIASEIGWTEGGLAIWSLRVHGLELLSRWVIIDRRFVAVEDPPARKRSGPRPARRSALGDG